MSRGLVAVIGLGVAGAVVLAGSLLSVGAQAPAGPEDQAVPAVEWVHTPPVRESENQAPVEPVRLELPKRGDRALARLERKEAELEPMLVGLVESGDLSEEEARRLYAASQVTLDDARSLVGRVQRGEVSAVGGLVRSVPLRLRHASMVVNVIGLDRARAIGDKRAAMEAQASDGANPLDPDQ